jgi:hypothetical protein
MGSSVFQGCAGNFSICYTAGATGFTTPTWNGYPAAACAGTTTTTSIAGSLPCIIKWWGDRTGWVPTNENSKTPEARHEAFQAIFNRNDYQSGPYCPLWVNDFNTGKDYCYWFIPDGCDGYFIWKVPGELQIHLLTCDSGEWESYLHAAGHSDACSYPTACTESGFWDVFCGDDSDADGIPDIADNCADEYNPDQRDNDNNGIGDACETATVIQLSSFIVIAKAGKVILEWTTETEKNNAGFNLYRAEAENGTFAKINTSLIPSKGSSFQGASYEFIDTAVRNRRPYYYKLEDIDLNGVSTFHCPVSATPRLIYGLK